MSPPTRTGGGEKKDLHLTVSKTCRNSAFVQTLQTMPDGFG
jgi:hypothetical protein